MEDVIGRRRKLVALLSALLTVVLFGALSSSVAAQTGTAQLQTSVVTEGTTGALLIVDAPPASGHYIRLKPFQAPYTASAADVEVRGANDVVIAAGAAARVIRASDGNVEFRAKPFRLQPA